MFAIYITAAFALVVSGPGVMGDSDDLSTQFQSYPTRPHPKGYVVYRTDTAPSITGRLDEAMWQAAEWTDEFVDVQGPDLPTPWYRTQVKMLWDDVYLYIGAKMEDPHPWADLTLHDSRVFHDNAFEVFIDPDGDNHMYYEVEVNAVDTIFDLLMVKPYRDGGPALTAFETVRSSEPTQWDGPTGWAPLKRAVHVDGTVNDGSAESKGWSVEMALPWSILCQAAMRACPPSDGDKWRINFSRMQWSVEWDTSSRKYYKQPPDQSANIWVWSPQYERTSNPTIHKPETWGYVQFSSVEVATSLEDPLSFQPDPCWPLRNFLMEIYYAQNSSWYKGKHYISSLQELGLAYPSGDVAMDPRIQTTEVGFLASAEFPCSSPASARADADAGNYDDGDGVNDDEEYNQPKTTLRLYINEEGRLWEKLWPI